MKGAYQVSVSDANAVLVFSAVGMQTIKETVGNRTTIDVVLQDEAMELPGAAYSNPLGHG